MRNFLDEYDRENPAGLTAEEVEERNAQVLSDTHRLVRMLSTGTTATGVFASMHWTLVEFPSPLVATSDHPLVLWPGAHSRSPASSEISQMGVLECIEIRLPLSPTRAVLMNWSDHFDDEHTRARGTRDHAANLNAFTVRLADRQWFHRPGRPPPLASGNLRPLSPELVPGYSEAAVANSERRRRAGEAVKKRIARAADFRDQEIEVVTISKRAAT
jgi:Protein of unknown function (DUF4238)